MIKKSLIGIVLVWVLLAGCGAKQEAVTTIDVEGGSYYEVNIEEFERMLENKDFPLINVHIPFEGDLPNTDLSIPYNEIGQHLDEFPADKDAMIFLYCRSDSMSGQAAAELAKLGYTNVWHLAGGFNAWKAAGNSMAE